MIQHQDSEVIIVPTIAQDEAAPRYMIDQVDYDQIQEELRDEHNFALLFYAVSVAFSVPAMVLTVRHSWWGLLWGAWAVAVFVWATIISSRADREAQSLQAAEDAFYEEGRTN